MSDIEIKVGLSRLVVLSYVYTDSLGNEELVTELFISKTGDFGPAQDAADKMHAKAGAAGGEVKHVLLTMVPPDLVKEALRA